ncbi:M50 family metallopeptidase [Sphingomonas sp. FW199]|uniref:M50 family metallopeptidase n=1 Tax=Sphingomonas sp. FW199 TaxID=3400217 RepID=UPI003CE6F067
MSESPGFLFYLIGFALVIGPLVFLHELGHYAAGRWFGVKAEAFSIGFGKEIAGFTDRRGTRWKFGWVPLGGYVKFAGDMNPAGQPSPEWLALPPEARAETFQAKPVWQRAIIVAAGPVTNFVIAVLILGALATFVGVERTPPVVGAVVEGSPAAQAGLQVGDRMTALNGRAVSSFGDVAAYVQLRPGERISLSIDRGGQALTLPLTTGVQRMRDRFGNEHRIGQLGVISAGLVYEPVSLIEAPLTGVVLAAKQLRGMVDGIGQIITGKRPIDELGGPLRIAKISGEQLSLGWRDVVILIAIISINLGFINLLPVPMLDGGHLMFYAAEAVRGRPVNPAVMDWSFRAGLVSLLTLVLVVTFNDLGAFGVWRGLAGLIGTAG